MGGGEGVGERSRRARFGVKAIQRRPYVVFLEALVVYGGTGLLSANLHRRLRANACPVVEGLNLGVEFRYVELSSCL